MSYSFLLPVKKQYILRQILVGLSLLPLIFSFPCYSKSPPQKKVKKAKWEQYWTRITLIDDPELFQSKKRKDRLASVTRTDPVNLNQLPDSKQFFKNLNLKKKNLFEAISTIASWKVHFHSWDKEKKVLFLKGTFSRKGQTIFFKEWHFYYKQYSLQILVEDTRPFSKTDKDIVALLDFLKSRKIK